MDQPECVDMDTKAIIAKIFTENIVQNILSGEAVIAEDAKMVKSANLDLIPPTL